MGVTGASRYGQKKAERTPCDRVALRTNPKRYRAFALQKTTGARLAPRPGKGEFGKRVGRHCLRICSRTLPAPRLRTRSGQDAGQNAPAIHPARRARQ